MVIRFKQVACERALVPLRISTGSKCVDAGKTGGKASPTSTYVSEVFGQQSKCSTRLQVSSFTYQRSGKFQVTLNLLLYSFLFLVTRDLKLKAQRLVCCPIFTPVKVRASDKK